MKRAILLLLLISFAFAQGGPESIGEAMSDLCNTSRSLLSTLSILFCLPTLPLIVLGAAVVALYKGENKTAKLLGKLALGAGIVFGVLTILGIVIYLLVPFIISSLMGPMPMGADPCSVPMR